MLYKIAHILRDHFGFLWDWIEGINSWLFGIRYSSGLKKMPEILDLNTNGWRDSSDNKESQVLLRLANVSDAEALARFFARQPEEGFTFFRPHDFDEKALRVLLKRTSFIMGVAVAGNDIVGYFFLRSFVHGRCYLGKMVDANWQGRGIGKLMCKSAMDIATALGVRMFESINKKNPASLRSSSVLKQVVIEELENDDLLIEDLPLR